MKTRTMQEPARISKNQARLALLGLILIVIQLTGCASAPLDESKYNLRTGYPAVGDRPWS